MINNIKVALVHDWLTGMRGGEKCLEVFCELFPEATVFTLIHKKGSVSSTIENMEIKTSFLQKIPGIEKKYRNFLPLFPRAIESFDLSDYDLVLSSSHCVAKGIKRPKGALHLCYCHTPVRYAWKFFNEYFSNEPPLKRWFISKVVNNLKKWDMKANDRVDQFIAISEYIKGRIKDYYHRTSDVIYPPVDVVSCPLSTEQKGYYLIVSALVPYKRIDLAIEAFSISGKPLVVIGIGSDSDRINSMAKGLDNITLKGWVPDAELKCYFAGAKALIFPGDEDFGIVPLEAQAYGKPVVAFAEGGALETVVPLSMETTGVKKAPTGVFFKEQTHEALNKAIEILEVNFSEFCPEKIRQNALSFSRDRYKTEIKEYVLRKWNEFNGNQRI